MSAPRSVSAAITHLEGMCGGQACVRGLRIPVWLLVKMRDLGMTDAEILDGYPRISAADLEAAWDYARLHAEEIAGAIEANELA